MKPWLPLSLLLLTAPTFCAHAQTTSNSTCQRLYSAGDYGRAIEPCRQGAAKGVAEDQANLGLLFLFGHGTVSDNSEAEKWLTLAANKGVPIAQYYLGRMHSVGMNGTRNDQLATDLYLKAAKQGQMDAIFMLAMAYRLGIGVPQDLKASYQWYSQLVKQNYLDAPSLSDKAFENKPLRIDTSLPGHGDYIKGMNLLLGTQGDPAPSEALSWFLNAADDYHPQAQHNLGLIYFDANSDLLDYQTAYEWFNRAQEDDYVLSKAYLAWMNALGLGTPADMKLALNWFVESLPVPAETSPQAKAPSMGSSTQAVMLRAQKGDLEAMLELSKRYRFGDGVSLDLVKAFRWLDMAASRNYPPALYELGLMTLEGSGAIQDSAKGIHLLRKAALANYGPAQFELGMAYFVGKFVAQNFIQAYAWLNVAAAHGEIEAMSAKAAILHDMDADALTKSEQLSREIYLEIHQDNG